MAWTYRKNTELYSTDQFLLDTTADATNK